MSTLNDLQTTVKQRTELLDSLDCARDAVGCRDF